MDYRMSGEAGWKERGARAILQALPGWFGNPEALEDYAKKTATLPALFAVEDDRPVGFAAYLPQTPFSAEICVMGVLPGRHREGVGRRLVQWCAERAAGEGRPYLTVKTLAESHPDPGYAATRAFYRAMGFVPLEVFPELWGADSPCLMMIKRVES